MSSGKPLFNKEGCISARTREKYNTILYLNVAKEDMADIPQSLYEAMRN
jgi:hypothetical protein